MLTPTKAELYDSLQSTVCPSCAGRKKPENTLCNGCYYDLSPALRAALYRRFGQGYEQAVTAALQALGADEFCTEADGADRR